MLEFLAWINPPLFCLSVSAAPRHPESGTLFYDRGYPYKMYYRDVLRRQTLQQFRSAIVSHKTAYNSENHDIDMLSVGKASDNFGLQSSFGGQQSRKWGRLFHFLLLCIPHTTTRVSKK